MRRPVSWPTASNEDYLKGRASLHAIGILGGAIWGAGTIANFVASYVPMIGPGHFFFSRKGNTMISAIWGVFIWKEFHGAGARSRVFWLPCFCFLYWG